MDLKKKNYGLELVVDKKDTEIEVLKIELAKYKAQAEKSRQTTKVIYNCGLLSQGKNF